MKNSVLFFFALLVVFCALTQSKNSKDKDKSGNGKKIGDLKKNEKNNGNTNGNGWKVGKWKKLLVEYGYASSMNSFTPEEIKVAVTKMRILFRFNNTMTDEDILKYIELPRCGNKDIKEKKSKKSKRRVRRYDLNPAWSKSSFTYSFKKYSSDLIAEQQRSIAAQAFQLWKNYVPELNFAYIDNVDTADIKFSFEVGTHDGCAQAFDGTGPILAHAYYPEDGRVHFDDDEVFTDQTSGNINLYAVLVHEIGHALGLGHSFVTGAVMHPVYQEYSGTTTLHEDDINGMRMLYAPETASNTGSACVDADPALCAYYQSEGYCNPIYADVMIETCPHTCNLCQ